MCASLSYLFNSSVISVQCVSFSKFVSCTPDVRLNILYMYVCMRGIDYKVLVTHAFHQFSLVIDLKPLSCLGDSGGSACACACAGEKSL